MRQKDLTKPKVKEKIIALPISKFIDSRFRDYALYVLTQRGIPSFYDALTPVQRFILKNTPTSFVKSLTVVGKVIQDHYHHGDMSITSALNKLARPFGCALRLLEGYGFFGSEVSPSPAAARYTSVKLSSQANGILNKYNHLTTREIEGPYDPFWMDVPIGLTTSIVGIAVGYSTTILPRKLKDIQEFLEGKRKTLKPYFEGFNGSIQKYKDLDKSWLITSNITISDRRVMIREIPPILKYTSALKKLDQLLDRFEGNVRIINNSNTKVNIDVVYTGKNSEEWQQIQDHVYKSFSIVVTENPVFIKDGQILVYDSVEQYLEDYKWQVIRLKLKHTNYEFEELTQELKFNEIKEKFILFMLTKKRSNEEIDIWMKQYEKTITERLERLTSRKFTIDELTATKKLIKELETSLKLKKQELKITKEHFEKTQDPTLLRGVSSKKNNVNLFNSEDITVINDITIWSGSDVFEDEEGVIQKIEDEEE